MKGGFNRRSGPYFGPQPVTEIGPTTFVACDRQREGACLICTCCLVIQKNHDRPIDMHHGLAYWDGKSLPLTIPGHSIALNGHITGPTLYIKNPNFDWLKYGDGKRLMHGECNVFHAYNTFSIVIGRMSEYGGIVSQHISGTIRYIIQGIWDSTDELEVAELIIQTACIGRWEPSIKLKVDAAGRFDGTYERLMEGEPVEVRASQAETLKHGGWTNSIIASTGAGGIRHDGMRTTIPNDIGDQKHSLSEIAKMAQCYRVFLSLLTNGENVDIEHMHVRFSNSKRATQFFAPLQTYTTMRLRLQGGLHEPLMEIKMQGLKKWMEWCSDFYNFHLLEVWLYTERKIAALLVLEGLGRRIIRKEQPKGEVNFVSACKAIRDRYDLNNALSDRIIKLLNKANIELVKHLGEVSEPMYKARTQQLNLGGIIADLIVGYGILRDALSKLPPKMDACWRNHINLVAEHFKETFGTGNQS